MLRTNMPSLLEGAGGVSAENPLPAQNVSLPNAMVNSVDDHEKALALRRSRWKQRYRKYYKRIRAYQNAYYHKTKHKRKTVLQSQRKRRYWKHREALLSKNRRWRSKNKRRVQFHSRQRIVRRFGITLEQYDSILKSQGGKCAICRGANKSKRRLAVDHCHNTNKVRGLLCSKCNTGIGQFQDSIDQLQKSITYLT